jgi:hypothetical protein
MTAARTSLIPCARPATTGRRPVATVVRAMTLVELVVSMAIASLLVTGLAAALVLAARALPRADRPTDRVLRTSEVVDWVLTELQSARHVTERSAQAITFTVADRDGDGSPERIRYAWSGAPGAPLTRQYNGGAAVAVLADVRQFEVTYQTRSTTEVYPGPNVEGDEVLLSAAIVPVDQKDYTIDSSRWIGQYSAPPSGAVAAGYLTWRITRVWFLACRSGPADDQTRVQVCVPNSDGTPSTAVLDEVLLDENALSTSFTWTQVTFSSPVGVPVTQGLCVVLRPLGSKASAQTRYDNNGGSGLLTTGDGGKNWSKSAGKSLLHTIYGRPAAPGPNQIATRRFLTGVQLVIATGTDAAARLETQVTLPNAPEVLSAVWEAEFDTDPTRLDMNADGQGDWVRRDGQPFDLLSLQGGAWKADSKLDTSPPNDFTDLTVAEVRFRCGSAEGNGAGFWINADWSSGTFAPLYAYLTLQKAGTQTLTVYAQRNAGTPVVLVSVAGLPADFVTLRLLIDPALDTVNVRVNGADKGTYQYFTLPATGDPRCASVFASGSTALFDYVRVRVAGSLP